MIRWIKFTHYSSRIIRMDAGRSTVCTATSPETADEMVQEHNALLECVEALTELRNASNDPLDTIWLRAANHRACAALEKLE